MLLITSLQNRANQCIDGASKSEKETEKRNWWWTVGKWEKKIEKQGRRGALKEMVFGPLLCQGGVWDSVCDL